MFELRLYAPGGGLKLVRQCDVGDLLPTIATMLQEFEAAEGEYKYQENYAIQWRRVKE